LPVAAIGKNMKKDYFLSSSIIISAVLVGGTVVYNSLRNPNDLPFDASVVSGENVLPVIWGDLGARMIQAGVIDAEKFETLYGNELNEEAEQLLYGTGNGNLKITEQNSGILLNLLWAFGLGNKNPILEEGPMSDSRYGGAGRFASTGGWTLAMGDAMNHYSRHQFVVLTSEQQDMVERVSKGIYRPCCGNPTYFPDCNHGMAMLGLLELLASQNASEDEMYRAALAVNSYWFPDTYLAIARLFEKRGISWDKVNPREVLGADYSSAQGFQRVLREIEPPQSTGAGGNCGI